MYFSYFVTFQNENNPTSRISEADLNGISNIVRETPGLKQAKLYTPETVKDLFTDDGPSPQFTMQLYFEDLLLLENAIGENGHLQALTKKEDWLSLLGTTVTQQVMFTRSFPVLNQKWNVSKEELPCTYLVHYPGPAKDLNNWLSYYINHHPQIMKLFPGIREIEIYTRVDWIDAMPWPRVNYMQRNKVVFDNVSALNEALNSTVRHEMHDDLVKFPPFEGGNYHYPMETRTITGNVIVEK